MNQSENVIWIADKVFNKNRKKMEPGTIDFRIRWEDESEGLFFILERRYPNKDSWEKLGPYYSVCEAQNAVDSIVGRKVPSSNWIEQKPIDQR
ncbi:MAG: hypothetical protein NUW37_00425 [Planctomycetes bacterium]|nr:hypothetical protein [Planctomycetota bacterium]